MTTKFERPGIYSYWQKRSKRIGHAKIEWADHAEKNSDAEFEHYLRNGESISGPVSRTLFPQLRNWYRLANAFFVTALRLQLEVERRALRGVAVDPLLAARVFGAGFTAEMIEAWCGPHGELGPGSLGEREIPITALGIVYGCQPQAFRLAKMKTSMFHKGRYSGRFPIFNFILRVTADYMGEPPTSLQGAANDESIHNALFELWRVDDPEALVEVCLAACDFHTQRCRLDSKRRPNNEFCDGFYEHTPLAVLLVFKLRQLLGLEIPTIDHPLMDTPLGQLPEETTLDALASNPDDILHRVRLRMMEDGYDEEEIFSRWGV